MQEVTFTDQWSSVVVDIPAARADLDVLSSVTLHAGREGGTLYLDDIRFSR